MEANLLILFPIVLMLLYIVKTRIINKKIIVDHITLLFAGYAYYFYLPFLLFTNGMFANRGQMHAYNQLTNDELIFLQGLFLGLVLVSIVADRGPLSFSPMRIRFARPNLQLLRIIATILLVIHIPATLEMLKLAFSTYNSSDWVAWARGPFITFTVWLSLFLSIYYNAMHRINLHGLIPMLAITFPMILLMGGNRGYMVLVLTVVLVAHSELNRGVHIKNFIILLLVVFFAGGFIAGLRSGNTIYSVAGMVTNALEEGGNVFTSLLIYWKSYDLELISYPASLFNMLIQILPQYLFPGKFKFLAIDSTVPYYLASSHMYVLILVNFGVVGSYLFIYLFISAIRYIRVRLGHIGNYSFIAALIPFMFFRDFELTFVKFMLFVGLILPLFLSMLSAQIYNKRH